MLAIKPATAPPKMKPVLRIRIRMDPELLPGSGSGINHSGSATLDETEEILNDILFVCSNID